MRNSQCHLDHDVKDQGRRVPKLHSQSLGLDMLQWISLMVTIAAEQTSRLTLRADSLSASSEQLDAWRESQIDRHCSY